MLNNTTTAVATVATTLCCFWSVDAAFSGDFKHCWQDENKYTACRFTVPADLSRISSVCPTINFYDNELFVDLLSCSGVTACWMTTKEYDDTNIAAFDVVKNANNAQLSEAAIRKEKERPIEDQEPGGKDACEPLQHALDFFMPRAIEALR